MSLFTVVVRTLIFHFSFFYHHLEHSDRFLGLYDDTTALFAVGTIVLSNGSLHVTVFNLCNQI